MSDNETRFQNPQKYFWLIFRSNQYGPQKSKLKTWTPNTKSQTNWPRETSHVMNGIIFFVDISFQFCSLLWSDVEKNTRRTRWRKSRSKIEADDEFNVKMSCKVCLDCISKLGKNHTWKSIFSELANWAVSQNRTTCWRHFLMKLLGMECWKDLILLKSGNLKNWWKSKQKDPLYSHSTRTDSLLKTIIWIFYPETESEIIFKSRSFLHRVNDQVRKRQYQSSKDATKDSDKHLWYGECLCLLHYKYLCSWWGLPRLFKFHQKYERSHNVIDVRHIGELDFFENQSKFMEWIQISGKIFQLIIFLRMIRKSH